MSNYQRPLYSTAKVQRKRIKKVLIDRELSISAVAEAVGVTPACISQTVYGKRHNPVTQEAIARALEMPVERLFG